MSKKFVLQLILVFVSAIVNGQEQNQTLPVQPQNPVNFSPATPLASIPGNEQHPPQNSHQTPLVTFPSTGGQPVVQPAASTQAGVNFNGSANPIWYPVPVPIIPPLDRSYEREEGVCSSINILVNITDFAQLANCRVIEGYLHIINIIANETSFENLTFPNLNEITDYLAVVKVQGLKSLGKLFPNLNTIRGQTQLIKGYSFVVVENPDLIELATVNLQHINRGAVRINSNPKLCYVETIDWSVIAPFSSHPFHFVLDNNPLCQVCPYQMPNGLSCFPADNYDYSLYRDDRRLCWNLTTCQYKCPKTCGGHGCNEVYECCDASCLGGCTQINSNQHCKACAYYKYNGVCVKKCPAGTIIHMDRRCISPADCRATLRPLNLFLSDKTFPLNPYFEFEGHCVLDCPPMFTLVNIRGLPSCLPQRNITYKMCEGRNITERKELKLLQECTHITGSLNITVEDKINVTILEQAFDKIQEIEGYLAITGTSSFKNLYPFKSLKTVHGKELFKDKYTLFFLFNENLENLFTTKQTVEIRKGSVFFAMNPSLCDSRIRKFQQSITEESGSCCDAVVIGNDDHC